MKRLVVYDSFFGNTEKIARAIGEGIGDEASVRRVGDVQPGELTDLSLLVVGSPTRAFRPSPNTTKFLGGIPMGALRGVKVAAFDTRADMESAKIPGFLRFMVRLFGYAAKPIADQLEKKGGTLAAPPEGFIVLDSKGPLKDGELERAAAWAGQLAK